MAIHPLAGKPAPADLLVDLSRLENAYFANRPNTDDPTQLVSFGTSGHRGTSLDSTFTELHILCISQAICDYREAHDYSGPLFLGKDSHALSGVAQKTALEVLAANETDVVIQEADGITPTPVISHAILIHNQNDEKQQADGIVVTPSHNPPQDGGFKYNPPNGGPADTDVTGWIQNRANELLRGGGSGVRRLPFERAIAARTTDQRDLIHPYVNDLINVLDLDAVRAAKLKIGVDPLGGASLHYWAPIAERYGLDLVVVNQKLDPTFRFMTVDHDGKIRMDCSSPYAMASLVGLKDRFDIAFGNDPDADRHGIVTRSSGLMNPNHYLAVAISYLLQHRPGWPEKAAVGKTLVSSSLIDKVVANLHRVLCEVPVGFKWFAPGLFAGTICFGGEESAGASFLRRNGTVWTTDKDGPILGLLAAEITARTSKDPGEHYRDIEDKFGVSYYTRIDSPASPAQKAAFKRLTAQSVTASTLAGDAISAKLVRAPGNHEAIGGLKVVTANGWFAARPSGTENVFKLYAESLVSEAHLEKIVNEAGEIVTRSLGS
jgi:phosphoglucomutase